MRSISLVTAAAFLAASLAARADSFNFTFGDSSSPFSGSGILTTGTIVAPLEYTIASVTGTAETAPGGTNRVIQSILAPGTFPTIANGDDFPANDNILFVINGVGTLDGDGLSFILKNGAQINLFNAGADATDALLERANGDDVFEDVPVTITAVSATPEPSSIALLGTGLLSIAGTLRRRLA